MDNPGKFPEAYRSYLEFVGNDLQRERSRTNRRMFSVFLWCFLVPVVISIAGLLLIKIGVFPRKARTNLDWLILVFPVLYSLYILSSEVLVGIPSMFKKGGLAASLKTASQEGEWRDRVSESVLTALNLSEQEWDWVVMSFKMDLENIRYRTKYLTALAGAVFFLIMQGIDSLGDTSESMNVWLKNPMMGWVEATNDISQLMALALFLVLLYLSGSQTYHSLSRYLTATELAVLRRRAKT
jgi:hypothetical protein